MASFNRVVLLGNVTRDIELRHVGSGTAVTDVGLAVNDRRKTPNGEWLEETTFVDVTLWGRTAEVAAEYLAKGSSCLIEGRLKLDTWESDGQKRSRLKVIGETLQLLGDSSRGSTGKRSNSNGSSARRAPQSGSGATGGSQPAMATEELSDADIPF